MMGVDGPQLYMNFLKPRIKVGNEFVTQGRNVNQVKKNSKLIFIIFKKRRKTINENIQTGRLLDRCHG